jgi:hypothetical protein
MSLPNSNFYLMPQFKTSGKGFNRGIGLQPGHDDNAPLPLLTFPQKLQLLTKKKKQKESFNNNNNSLFLLKLI